MTKRRIVSLILVLAMLVSVMSAMAVVSFADSDGITEASGWLESAYVKWAPISGADGYNVYVQKVGASGWDQIDEMLIRKYPDYWRADVVGLAAGNYVIKIVPVSNGAEVTSGTLTTGVLNVLAHDRSGYAFVNGSSSGAYNNDGTLKSNARVIYVTEQNKDTVTLDVLYDKTAQTFTGLQNILNAYKKQKDTRPLCVRIIGNITDLAVMDKGDLLIDNNVQGLTIEGIGEDTVLNGFGIRVKGCSNVEIRNLATMNCDSNEGDNIGLQQDNDHIWVHNCDFFYGHAGSDSDQAKGDGSLDTKTSTYVTHSYNHFWDSGKCNLQGMKDESTSNYITYHHNWYDHADSRMPRIRTCTVHVYNNFYDGVSKYAVGATMGSSVFVENNYFLNTKYPMLISLQGSDIAGSNEGTFSGENGGIIKAYGNTITGSGNKPVTYQQNSTQFDCYLASSRDEQVPSSVTALKGGTTYNNFDTASNFYQYDVQTAEDAMNTVKTYAGRVNGGDFKWTFTTADNTSYDVNQALKSKLTSYKTTLVSVGGNSVVTGSTGGNTNIGGATVPGGSGSGSGSGSDNSGSGDVGGGMDLFVPAGAQIYNFSDDNQQSSFFSVVGTVAKDKGNVYLNDLTLNKCLKMESGDKTSITFSSAEGGELLLLFGGSTAPAGHTVKINETACTVGTNNMIKVDLNAGTYKIQKGDAQIFLYYIVFTPSSSGSTHTHSYTESITKDATCTEAGEKKFSCSCGESYTETIEALEHSFKLDGTNPAGCLTDGVKIYKCSRCDELKYETTPPIGHNYSSEITKAPSCTATGVKTFTCDNCGDSYTEILDAKGHNYEGDVCSVCGTEKPIEHEHSYTGSVVKEPTCTEGGMLKYLCSCGESYFEQTNPKGHKYVIYYFSDPTCTEEGEDVYKCSCGATYTDKIDATGHNYKEEIKNATCTEAGVKTYTCNNCEDSYSEKIAAKGHSFENGACSVCGVEEKKDDVTTPELPDNDGADDDDKVEEKPAEKLNFFQRIFRAIGNFFRRLFGKPTK